MLFAVIFFAAIGAFFLTSPRKAWELQHMFTVKNGEPTEFAVRLYRMIGGLFILFAAGILVCRVFGIS